MNVQSPFADAMIAESLAFRALFKSYATGNEELIDRKRREWAAAAKLKRETASPVFTCWVRDVQYAEFNHSIDL